METVENRRANELETECSRLADALALAERDRQQLGYEIHDGVVQDLTAAAMHLESAGQKATFASPEVQENYAGGLKLLRESIAEARGLIRGLVTAELDERGLVSALIRLVEKFRALHGLPVMFDCAVNDVELPSSVQHLLLRIVQEALYNTWKHARAKEVVVRLAMRDEKLELAIADDGIGFDPLQVPAGHFGLEGIRARCSILGAELLIDTAPDHGARVVVRIAVPKTM